METIRQYIPSELLALPCWVVWRYEQRGGRRTKVPYSPTQMGRAKSNDPATWGTYAQAQSELQRRAYDGMGLMFDGAHFGVDIDHCIDPQTGEVTQQALDIVSTLGSYTEISPSGTGLHILCKGMLPTAKGRRQGAVEVYGTGRYFTVTGKPFGSPRPLQDGTEAIRGILAGMDRPTPPTGVQPSPASLDDAALLDKIRQSRQGAAFSALWCGDIAGYPSHSEADLALCNILAFWTGRDAARVDALFRASGLMRDKWDRHPTYAQDTIQRAIQGTTAVYGQGVPVGQAFAGVEADATLTALAGLNPHKNPRYGWNDIGNGNLFADMYKDRARYVPERKVWFVYDGKRWKADPGAIRVMELCKRLADALLRYVSTIEDERERCDYLNFVRKWQRRAYRETILKDAMSVHPVAYAVFDRSPHLLNCENGTLNVLTGEFTPHRAADMITMLAGVRYNPLACCERWERFIVEVMEADAEKALFLQKALGYALTGDTSRECLFILYGATSRNGKSTCMDTFARLMGDYAKTASPDTIAQKQKFNGSAPTDDLARLAGARFVNIPEPDKKLVLATALVKTMTGNDIITARFLHEGSFEYRPHFKLFINTNHLPAVTDVSLFQSGRVKVIPFNRHFNTAERDEGLKAALSTPESLSGVLNWCLKGLWLMRETGFDMPQSVVEATEEYRVKSDKVGRFLSEEMTRDANAETRTGEVYERYRMWCAVNGFFPENAANFKGMLAAYGPVRQKRPQGAARSEAPTNFFIGYRF